MRDLEHTATMIVWPQPLPGTDFTPSPFVDELKRKTDELDRKTAELNKVQSRLSMQQLIEEESNCHKKQGGKG
jgi:hypothetical protein